MNTKAKASAKSFAKFLVWTAIGAVCVAAVNNLAALNLPEFVIPLLGAALKALATYAATEANEP